MDDRHLTLDEIATAAGLAKHDPRRRHLEVCARCRTLQRRHEQFVAQPTHVPAADVRDAEARLAEFLAREVAPAEATELVRDSGRQLTGRARATVMPAWFGGTALAAAAAVLVVGALVLQRPSSLRGRVSGVLRGQGREVPGAAIRPSAPVLLADGRVELRWSSVAAADHYEVRLHSPELRPLAVVGTSRETVLVLAPGAVAGAAAGDTLLWQVTALRGEVPLAQSSQGILRLP